MSVNMYELLYMARMRDEDAVWQIWQQHEGICRMLANETVHRYPDYKVNAEELADEGRYAFFQGIEDYRYDCDANFSTYITLVMKRAMRNVMRKVKARKIDRKHIRVEIDTNIAENYVLREDKDDTLLYRIAFIETLDKLTDKESDVIHHYIQGIPRKEAIVALSITGKSYDATLARVKAKMQTTHKRLLNHEERFLA